MKIVADSCTELTAELRKELQPELVPFKITIDGVHYTDDDDLDIDEFINIMVNSESTPKSSCPAPHDFANHFEDENEDEIFGITISSFLSGSYNSAQVAKKMVEEKFNKAIKIFDCKSAAAGQTLVALKIKELMDNGKSFAEISKMVDEYIESIQTMFVASSLNNLIKNGRIPSWKGKLAQLLNIMPIMKGVDGKIDLYKKVRGKNKVWKELVSAIKEFSDNTSNRVLAIVHIDNEERAQLLKTELEKLNRFKDIVIIKGHALSAVYADNKGIIVSF